MVARKSVYARTRLLNDSRAICQKKISLHLRRLKIESLAIFNVRLFPNMPPRGKFAKEEKNAKDSQGGKDFLGRQKDARTYIAQ